MIIICIAIALVLIHAAILIKQYSVEFLVHMFLIFGYSLAAILHLHTIDPDFAELVSLYMIGGWFIYIVIGIGVWASRMFRLRGEYYKSYLPTLQNKMDAAQPNKLTYDDYMKIVEQLDNEIPKVPENVIFIWPLYVVKEAKELIKKVKK